MERIRKLARGSIVLRFLAAIARFLSRQWYGSAIVSRFLGESRGFGGRSVFGRAVGVVRGAEVRAFKRLKLDRAARGGLFATPIFWCCATVMLAPIVPTTAAIGLAGVTLFSVFLKLGSDGDFRVETAPVTKFILLYVFVTLVGTLTSVDFRGSLFGGLLLVFFALFAVLTQYAVTTRRELERVIWLLVLGGFAVACYGGLQYVRGTTGASAWLDSEMFAGTTRVFSTLQNPNVLAEYLLLVIPFAAAKIITAKDDLRRVCYIVALAAMLVCMALTFARGGWLGLIAAAAVFLIMLDRRFIIVGIVGLIALYFVLPQSIIARFTSIGNVSDGSTSYRIYIWLGTLALIRTHWLIGIGPGVAAFTRVYPLYAYSAIVAPHSHNLFLQVMCDGGVFALLGFVGILCASFRSLARGVRRSFDRTIRVYRIAGIAALTGFIVQGMTDYSFYNYRVTLVFWAVVGLCAVMSRRGFDAAEGGA
ncbi:MAG: O-antigen ligase family protein [Oscillospiraceae bacterium]|nr:O-antigen ligase family protein [Oscillospiraceae bacterium]